MKTERELKLYPRIEQLLRENSKLRNGKTTINDDVEGLVARNEYLKEQLNKLKHEMKGSYHERSERNDLIM